MSVLGGNDTLFLTATELAPILRISPSAVQKAAGKGRIPGAIKPLGSWLFEQHTVRAWIEQLVRDAGGLPLDDFPTLGELAKECVADA